MPLKVKDDVKVEDVREYAKVEDVRLEEGGNGDAEYVELDVEGNGEKVEDGEKEEDIEYKETDFEQTNEEDDNVFHRHVVIEEVDDQKEPGEVFESLSEREEAELKGRNMGLRAPKFKQYNKEHDLLDPKFHMGVEFLELNCRQAIRYYSVACARKIKYLKNKPYKVRLVCDDAPEGNEESTKDLTKTKRQG
ncbi:hypothetical protein ACE6H2_007572 [Prunus campanulata]